MESRGMLVIDVDAGNDKEKCKHERPKTLSCIHVAWGVQRCLEDVDLQKHLRRSCLLFPCSSHLAQVCLPLTTCSDFWHQVVWIPLLCSFIVTQNDQLRFCDVRLVRYCDHVRLAGAWLACCCWCWWAPGWRAGHKNLNPQGHLGRPVLVVVTVTPSLSWLQGDRNNIISPV